MDPYNKVVLTIMAATSEFREELDGIFFDAEYTPDGSVIVITADKFGAEFELRLDITTVGDDYSDASYYSDIREFAKMISEEGTG